MRRLLPRFAVVLLCSIAACTSPNELYDRGQTLESEGRYEEAMDHYIRALEGEPAMQKAQGRLRVVGSELAGRYVAEARALSTVEAAEAYLAADVLVQRAATVGVTLRMPSSFAADRDAALDAAVEALLRDGAEVLATGDYETALTFFERARVFRPTGVQTRALDTFTYDAYLDWAEEGFAAGQFRAAYDRAEGARAYIYQSEGEDAIDALLETILEAGSVTVAVFPVEAGDAEARSDMPRGFAAEFDDLLEDDHWSQPPLFIRTLEPSEVRRFLRAERDTEALFGRVGRVGRFTDRLGTDLGAVVRLGHLLIEDRETDRDTLSAPLRRGEGTGQYLRIEQRRTLDGTAEAVVVRSDGTVVCRERVSAEASGRLRTGRILGRGDPSLVLPSRDRDLFDERALEEAERNLERELQDRLAARLAERVFACMGAQVP